MAREQLTDLAADVDQLLVAGLARGHADALSRRARALCGTGTQEPELAAFADAAGRVAEADKPGSAFLDLLVAARQLRAGRATAGVEGTLTPPPESGPWLTPTPVRDLLPVHVALAESGPGRAEIIEEAVGHGLFGDLRLAGVALAALADGDDSVADAVADRAVPSMGTGVVGELREGLNLQGKASDARRLRAICLTDPAMGAVVCRRALAEGNALLKSEALHRLPEVAPAGEAERAGLKHGRDRNREVRIGAVRAVCLGKGEAALAFLLETLDDEDAPARDAAVASLGTFRNPQTTARLLAELRRVLPLIRESGPNRPGKKAPKGMAAPARWEAIVYRAEGLVAGLGRRKDGDLRAVARTILPLIADDSMLTTEAAGALATLGPVIDEIVPTLAGLLTSRDDLVPEAALSVLRAFPPAARESAVPTLASLAENAEWDDLCRLAALDILAGHVDRHGKTVLRAARALLADRAVALRYGWGLLLAALEKLGRRARPLLPDLFDAFRDAAGDIASGIGEGWRAVARIDPAGVESIPVLIELLGHDNGATRQLALFALAGFGPKARGAVPAVERLAVSGLRPTRTLAEQVLEAIR